MRKMKARRMDLSCCYGHLRDYRWLIHNQGVEITVAGGPYKDQKDFADGLVEFLGGEDFDAEDTCHILSFKDGGPETTDFSSHFMEAAKRLARPDDPGWSEFEGTAKQAKKIVYG